MTAASSGSKTDYVFLKITFYRHTGIEQASAQIHVANTPSIADSANTQGTKIKFYQIAKLTRDTNNQISTAQIQDTRNPIIAQKASGKTEIITLINEEATARQNADNAIIGGASSNYNTLKKIEDSLSHVIFNTTGDFKKVTSHAAWSARSYTASVVFNNKMWVLGGRIGTNDNSSDFTNDVWSSSDGINWTQATANAPWTARYGHTSVVFNNKMWVLGGFDTSRSRTSDVWSSSDGINWTQATANAWPPSPIGSTAGSAYHTSVVFNNKIWVYGGNNLSHVWSSSDGINWTKSARPIPWGIRQEHTSVVFNNKMWVLGGYHRSMSGENHVWSSSDGINWTQAINATWSRRYDHTSVVFNNKMWVLGGRGNSLTNDVWYSSDGINWTRATANASWGIRQEHASVCLQQQNMALRGT